MKVYLRNYRNQIRRQHRQRRRRDLPNMRVGNRETKLRTEVRTRMNEYLHLQKIHAMMGVTLKPPTNNAIRSQILREARVVELTEAPEDSFVTFVANFVNNPNSVFF